MARDCEQCRFIIHWPEMGKNYCGWWILTEGKAKKVELSKLMTCPKEEALGKATEAIKN